MNPRACSLSSISAGMMVLVGLSAAAESREYLKGDRPQQRGYSEAVITEGGRTVWLAGQTATVDDNGRSLASSKYGSCSRTWIAHCRRLAVSSVIWCR